MRVPKERSNLLRAYHYGERYLAESFQTGSGKKFSDPKKVKDIQAFIGLAGYYRKFMEAFSKIVKSLTKLTKKGEKFEWTTLQQCVRNFEN